MLLEVKFDGSELLENEAGLIQIWMWGFLYKAAGARRYDNLT